MYCSNFLNEKSQFSNILNYKETCFESNEYLAVT